MTFTDWKNLLTEQGSTSEMTADAQLPLLITPLLHQTLLSVSGLDASKFLQGQLTCDVNLATDDKTILGAACNPQGRTYSSFRLIPAGTKDDSGFFLRMRSDILDATAANLNKYIVFYKAKATNERENFAGIGISGNNSIETITRLFGQCPTEDNQLTNSDQGLIIKLPGQTIRFECWIPIKLVESIWQQLTAETTTGNINDWIFEDIESGTAEVSEATYEAFIPQMLNYHSSDAISFTKGCYTGQEVVARMQYRGKSKRTLAKIIISDAPSLGPGQQLHIPDKDQNIATIVSSATSIHNDTQHCLAVVSTELTGNGKTKLCLDEACFDAEIINFSADTDKI